MLGLHDTVAGLPDGYATSVEDSCITGSPGLQQVTIAVLHQLVAMNF